MNQLASALALQQLYRKRMIGLQYDNVKEPSTASQPVMFSTLDALHTQITQCHLCELSKMRNHAFAYYGDMQADIMIIDDYVMAAADLANDITATKANALLQKMVENVLGIPLSSTYYTHVLKCLPQNFNALHEPLTRCIDYLDAQISLIKPKLIICLGDVALQHLMGTDYSYSHHKMTPMQYKESQLLVIEHPNKVLRNPSIKKVAFQELLFVKQKMESL